MGNSCLVLLLVPNALFEFGGNAFNSLCLDLTQYNP